MCAAASRNSSDRSRASDLVSDMYAQTVASRSHRAVYKPSGSTRKTAVRATPLPPPPLASESRAWAASRHGRRPGSRVGTRPLPSPVPHGCSADAQVDPAGNSAASGSMRDVAVLSSSQMKSIQGLVGNTLEQSVLSTVELQRMKDTASGEIERRAAAARQSSLANKAEGVAKAKARKEAMAVLEQQRRAAVPLTDIEQAKLEAKAAARRRVQPSRQTSGRPTCLRNS